MFISVTGIPGIKSLTKYLFSSDFIEVSLSRSNQIGYSKVARVGLFLDWVFLSSYGMFFYHLKTPEYHVSQVQFTAKNGVAD